MAASSLSERITPVDELSVRVEEPVYISSAGRQLFGWLYRSPSEDCRPCGVVVCPSFGFEALCLYRSVRALCQAIAALGLPALRFDYAGTGDSEDIAPSVEQIGVWREDIHAAVRELQRQTGVQTVCLMGLRLGALLAASAAPICPSVRALVALAAPGSGRRLLRELQLQSWQEQSTAPALVRGAVPPPASTQSLEVSGFLLSSASVASLRDLELPSLPTTLQEVLILDRADLPAAQAWAQQLRTAGVSVAYEVCRDYGDMVKPPQLARVPVATNTLVANWLAAWQQRCRERTSVRSGVLPHVRPARPAMGPWHGLGAGVAVERPLWMGATSQLFGIVTEPSPGTVLRGAVLFLNSGGDHHVGPRRMYVSLARRWSALGFVGLRMDLMGLGDSGPAGQACPGIFPPTALADIAAAMGWLCEHYAVQRVTLCGLCSGAFHALRAAYVDQRVGRLLLINPVKYLLSDTCESTEMDMAEAIGSARQYRRRVLSWQAWRKLLAGQLDFAYLRRVCRARARLALGAWLHEVARRMGLAVREDLGRELQALAQRGVQMHVLFSRGDPGYELLQRQAGSVLQNLSKQLHLYFMDGANHDFTAIAARTRLERLFTDLLDMEDSVQSEHASPTTLPAVEPLSGLQPDAVASVAVPLALPQSESVHART